MMKSDRKTSCAAALCIREVEQVINQINEWIIHDDQAEWTTWKGVPVLQLAGGKPVLYGKKPFHPPFRMTGEIAIAGKEGYAGFVFGAKTAHHYEAVYIYPDSEASGWIQYDSCMNNSMTWQIYHGSLYQARIDLQPGDWNRLRIDVQPSYAEVKVGTSDDPQLTIYPYLQGASGYIGLWGYLKTYVKRFSVTPIPLKELERPFPRATKPEGAVADWEVAIAKAPVYPAGDCEWIKAEVENNGILNLNRLFQVEKKQFYIRTKVFSRKKEYRTISFGYSDYFQLWVNGREIHQGMWIWDPPKDGRIYHDYQKVKVEMNEGWNWIIGYLRVEEPHFGAGLILTVSG